MLTAESRLWMSMPGARSAACSTIFSTTRSTTFWTSTSRMTSWVTTFSTSTSLMVSTGTSLITSLVTTVSTGTSLITSLVTTVSTGTSFTTSLTSVTVTVTVFSTTSASPHAARAATPTPPASAAAPPRSSLRRLKDLLGPIDIPLPYWVRSCMHAARILHDSCKSDTRFPVYRCDFGALSGTTPPLADRAPRANRRLAD